MPRTTFHDRSEKQFLSSFLVFVSCSSDPGNHVSVVVPLFSLPTLSVLSVLSPLSHRQYCLPSVRHLFVVLVLTSRDGLRGSRRRVRERPQSRLITATAEHPSSWLSPPASRSRRANRATASTLSSSSRHRCPPPRGSRLLSLAASAFFRSAPRPSSAPPPWSLCHPTRVP